MREAARSLVWLAVVLLLGAAALLVAVKVAKTIDGEPVDERRPAVVVRNVTTTDTVVVRYDHFTRVTDTVTDTLYIPIVQTRFDTVVEWVRIGGTIEGWHARLDSLSIEVLPQPQSGHKQSKWGLGVTAGAGVAKGGWSPFVGVGLTYNILAL